MLEIIDTLGPELILFVSPTKHISLDVITDIPPFRYQLTNLQAG